ncbi:MAG TPA: penicillin-binding transpeptidase domain-containing protein [Actinomycetes bacterium]
MARRYLRAVSAVATVGLLAALATACGGDDGSAARATARAYVAAWTRGDDAKAARLTDSPEQARTTLTEAREGLSVTTVAARLGTVATPKDGRTVAPLQVRLHLRGLGEWGYSTELRLHQTGDGDNKKWVVAWSPAVVHPDLTAATRLSRSRELPPRAPVLGGDGKPLMAEHPVVEIGIEPRRLTDPKRAYAELARLEVDTTALAARVAAARPDHFVTVITLRREDFARSERRLRAVPGLLFRDGSRTLAPSPTFARAVLGAVRPATKESLAKAGPLATAADEVGASGLQQAFQEQLAGTPSGEVRLVQRSDGTVAKVLHAFVGKAGTPVRTTLDRRTQQAAETALAKAKAPAALVAVRPSTGEVLAAANAPADNAYNRAFLGRYPPGSTFKVVSATALLRSGMKADQPVACPKSVTVEGKKFSNYDDLGALGTVPFAKDFAMSCNTAFIGATRSLPRDALSKAAAAYGVGQQWDLGVGAFSGSVPTAASAVEQAADTIGQGKVLMSPLAMAVVAAGVASGKPRPPVLVTDDQAAAATAPPALDVAGTLRSLMVQTVRGGTARVLALPGAAVGGKTGTAEYGTDSPPRHRAWMVGFRGDLAFAVLVEDGESGSKTAGPIARAFLQAVT